MKKSYYVYILANQNNKVLYIGITNDLKRRVIEHKNKIIKGFTEKYNINKLVFYKSFENIDDALMNEKRIKKWKRVWKIRIIEEHNPNWNDLAKDF